MFGLLSFVGAASGGFLLLIGAAKKAALCGALITATRNFISRP